MYNRFEMVIRPTYGVCLYVCVYVCMYVCVHARTFARYVDVNVLRVSTFSSS